MHAIMERVDTVTFKRKPPSQIHRDRRRAEDFKQKKDNAKNSNVLDPRATSESEIRLENGLNTCTETIDNKNAKALRVHSVILL